MNSGNIPSEPSERETCLLFLKKKKSHSSPDSSVALLPKCAFGGTRPANVSPSASKYHQVYFH